MATPENLNVKQVYDNNPSDTLLDDDLFYLGRAPYGQANDMAVRGAVLKNAIRATWVTVTDAYVLLQPNVNYIINRPSLVMLAMPASAAVGASIKILNINSGGWQIAQNTGQNIIFGDKNTTTGPVGYLASATKGDKIELTCVIENSMWFVEGVIGNITFA
ncbi:hypothetical protein AQUSIP_12980 [Aquicella siphonis]|uniref:Uncharacterized protein n=1 Tax=Aquicella siphonis TaxID=254247 RepID=A0A5E4PHR9_9COXI|nr:hypothetical protein [Aquicella siphonis]VVC75997.1 hypothetical protein AQUSIP_12980 [Aquicella siphonis]